MASNSESFDVIVIGGGAAGFFSAIRIKELQPKLNVLLVEKSSKLLSKVAVSGGGRCNVTHNPALGISAFSSRYPRGAKLMKKLLPHFSAEDTWNWFEKNGVALKVEDDGRVFPISNSSSSIVNCLMDRVDSLGIKIWLQCPVKQLKRIESGFTLALDESQLTAKYVVVATGGSPKLEGFNWLKDLGHTISPPIPSLFTFNIPKSIFKPLSGVALLNAKVKVEGVKLEESGPLLITHWGLSGPAVLRLSAWGARQLGEMNYQFTILVQWNANYTEETTRDHLAQYKLKNPKRKVGNYPLYDIPSRLWEVLVGEIGITEKAYNDLSKRDVNLLIESLIRFRLSVNGKTTFKEEFVTCGGIGLDSIDTNLLESKSQPGLFFAGEVLDVDGITGGFNFQNAWTGADTVARAIASNQKNK